MEWSRRKVSAAITAALAVSALAGTLWWSSRTGEPVPSPANEPSQAAVEVDDAAPPSGPQRDRRNPTAAPRSDEYPWIRPDELKARLDAGERIAILNTRAAPDEPLIPGAVRVDELDVEKWAASASKSRPVVAYCSCYNDAAGVRSALALQKLGFTDVHVLEGGFSAWQAAGYPTQPARGGR